MNLLGRASALTRQERIALIMCCQSMTSEMKELHCFTWQPSILSEPDCLDDDTFTQYRNG
ncbi:hypothetical protein FRX31_004951 [Thalictrum thalictroides]|uniref:Uncharacterized protein n=1 Tax=Thalictrum thalictroides TaxID=46969 RepID=A0A7J6XAS9_THATH|nr:hypothetical protein FRX31_004951 [Thalictrum thalictroides]